jgi:hypothetical protein
VQAAGLVAAARFGGSAGGIQGDGFTTACGANLDDVRAGWRERRGDEA